MCYYRRGRRWRNLRDLLLNIVRLLWVKKTICVCIRFSGVVLTRITIAVIASFGSSPSVWPCSAVERAIGIGSAPLVAIAMGVITASFGGIIATSLVALIIFARESMYRRVGRFFRVHLPQHVGSTARISTRFRHPHRIRSSCGGSSLGLGPASISSTGAMALGRRNRRLKIALVHRVWVAAHAITAKPSTA